MKCFPDLFHIGFYKFDPDTSYEDFATSNPSKCRAEFHPKIPIQLDPASKFNSKLVRFGSEEEEEEEEEERR